jgi:hypothetical protein
MMARALDRLLIGPAASAWRSIRQTRTLVGRSSGRREWNQRPQSSRTLPKHGLDMLEKIIDGTDE